MVCLASGGRAAGMGHQHMTPECERHAEGGRRGGWMDGGGGQVIYTASVRLWRLKEVRNWFAHSSGAAVTT